MFILMVHRILKGRISFARNFLDTPSKFAYFCNLFLKETETIAQGFFRGFEGRASKLGYLKGNIT